MYQGVIRLLGRKVDWRPVVGRTFHVLCLRILDTSMLRDQSIPLAPVDVPLDMGADLRGELGVIIQRQGNIADIAGGLQLWEGQGRTDVPIDEGKPIGESIEQQSAGKGNVVDEDLVHVCDERGRTVLPYCSVLFFKCMRRGYHVC